MEKGKLGGRQPHKDPVIHMVRVRHVSGSKLSPSRSLSALVSPTATDLKTMKPDWIAAQNDCARFQKHDPIKIN